jgi:hypothetical protein
MPCARSIRVAHDRTGNLPTMSSVAAAEVLRCGLVSTVTEPEGLFEAGLCPSPAHRRQPGPTLRLKNWGQHMRLDSSNFRRCFRPLPIKRRNMMRLLPPLLKSGSRVSIKMPLSRQGSAPAAMADAPT